MGKYYTYHDDLKMNAFLSIPKILFSDERYKNLNVTSKLIYSLFLNRYISTTYKDDTGPYVIFSDKELVEKLGIGRTTCVRARNELRECQLISFTKSVSYNKIYLYSYLQDPLDITHFFTEEDLQGYKFYKFPIEFFDEKYKNLPLTAKLVYTVYLDTLCLSQVNYFVDSSERIYFQESREIQIKKLNFTKPTIKEARNLLQVCGLLLEYKKFAEDIRYYLLKLTHFTDRIEEYKSLTKEEQKQYIKKITDEDKQELIINPKKVGYKLREKRLNTSLTQLQVVQYLEQFYGIKISRSTYNKYELGRIHVAKDIYDKVIDILDNHKNEKTVPIKENNDTIDVPLLEEIETTDFHKEKEMKHDSLLLEKDDTIKSKDMTQSIEKKVNNQKKKNETYITYTEDINTESINTKNNLLIKLINQINNSINISIYLQEKDKAFIEACFDKLRTFKKFYMSKDEHMIEEDELINYLETISNPVILEKNCIFILEKINTSHYIFKTPENQINCFLTFLFNELKQTKEKPSWFTGQSELITQMKVQSALSPKIEVDEAIKNYKWWEE